MCGECTRKRSLLAKIERHAGQPPNWLRMLQEMLIKSSRREALLIALPAFAVALCAFWLLFAYARPAPPRVVTMVTGSEGGAYEHFGKIYKEALAREGIELRLRRTSGSVENVRLLNTDPEIDLGFVQGGILNAPNSTDLNQLGSLFPEPMWIFTRPPIDEGRLSSLRGKRIGIGASGSGTQLLALQLLGVNGFALDSNDLFSDGEIASSRALRGGTLDALLMVAGAQSPVLQTLLAAPGIGLLDLTHSEAYKRRFPHLETLTLPAATLDFVGGRPAHDVHLLGSNAVLVGKVDLHPALVSLLLQTAKQIHGEPGLFQRRGEFPAIRDGGLPVNPQAQRFYEYGTPLLQRYLPFWLAVLIDRLLVSLLPVLAILLPLIRIAPPLYAWRKRSKIYRWYGELKFLEQHARTCPQSELGEVLERLGEIELHAAERRTPLAFANELYTLREHVALVRASIIERHRHGTATPKEMEIRPEAH